MSTISNSNRLSIIKLSVFGSSQSFSRIPRLGFRSRSSLKPSLNSSIVCASWSSIVSRKYSARKRIRVRFLQLVNPPLGVHAVDRRNSVSSCSENPATTKASFAFRPVTCNRCSLMDNAPHGMERIVQEYDPRRIDTSQNTRQHYP